MGGSNSCTCEIFTYDLWGASTRWIAFNMQPAVNWMVI